MPIGEIAALMTALFWTFSSLSFAYAGKRIGSLNVNILRLTLAASILTIINYFMTSGFATVIIDIKSICLLFVSGLVGFVIGDLFLFQAFILMGARISMLIMALCPPMTALLGFFLLKEEMSILSILSMFVVFLGIALVVTGKGQNNKLEIKHPIKGLLYAFIGAFGQALGLIFSKLGMKDYGPFFAAEVRVIAGIIGFSVVITVMRKWSEVRSSLGARKALIGVATGTVFGPVLGVAFAMIAIQNTKAGIVATLMSITPVLIIPISVFILKEKVYTKEVLGAIIAVLGVASMFM